jgi:hypothetical protein
MAGTETMLQPVQAIQQTGSEDAREVAHGLHGLTTKGFVEQQRESTGFLAYAATIGRKLLFQTAQTIGQMETCEHSHTASLGVASLLGDIHHELVDGMGQRLHLAWLAADRQDVGLIVNGNSDSGALRSGIHTDILSPCEQVHLAEKFFDAYPSLFALRSEVFQFLTELARVGYGRIALSAQCRHQVHGTVDTLFESRQSVVV